MHQGSWSAVPLDRPTPDRFWFNVGPSYRTITTRIRVTVLGNPDISISWAQSERVGLIFEPGVSPLDFVEDLLVKEGFNSPDELRRQFELPASLLTCRNIAADTEGLVDAVRAERRTVLRHALILGLCGASFYDPGRPVIWTNNRLSRKLDLFGPGRFYADN